MAVKNVFAATAAAAAAVYLLVVSLSTRVVSAGDLTGPEPTIGNCLCLKSDTNVKGSACGATIGSTVKGQCYPYTGVTIVCDDQEFMQLMYDEVETAWICSDYVNVVANDSRACSSLSTSRRSQINGESKYLIIGDWGVLPNENIKVATAMANWADKNSVTWIVTTGDNFYPNGINAWNDPAVDVIWRNVFKTYTSLEKLNWKVSLGNHDYGTKKGEEWNQIELSKHDPQWQLPHLWYDWIDKVGDFAVHWVVIDTEALVNKVNNYTTMMEWLDRTLQESTADWLFVVAHRNVFSAGDNGPVNANLFQNFLPILEKHSVDAYICGHDHNLQHIRNQGGKGMDFVISGGGGAKLDLLHQDYVDSLIKTYAKEVKFFKATSGFVALTATKNELLFQYFNDNNEILYSFTRPRNRKSPLGEIVKQRRGYRGYARAAGWRANLSSRMRGD